MSIQSQINAAASGATVVIAPGEYREGVLINKPLTLKAGGAVRIRSPRGMAGIRIAANHVTIDGLVDGVPSLDIVAVQDDGIEGNNVHHAVVRGVVAHGCGESGIQFNWSEWITVEDCVCYDNAHLSWYSGISVYQCRELSDDGSGFRTIIRRNVCYENVTDAGVGAHTDGNGIIIDDNRHTQGDLRLPYPHATLVENNLCYRNGSKGIAIAWSDNVTVRNNTVAFNNRDRGNTATWRGDLSDQSGVGCVFEDNIAVCDPATHARSTALGEYGLDGRGTNVWRRNMAWPAARATYVEWNGNRQPASGYVVADPQLDANWIPANPAAASMGWRPVTPPVTPPADPLAALAARVAVLEGVPADYGPRIIELTEKVATLEAGQADLNARLAALEGAAAPDLSGVQEELARLDARLDAISGAAGD